MAAGACASERQNATAYALITTGMIVRFRGEGFAKPKVIVDWYCIHLGRVAQVSAGWLDRRCTFIAPG